jgi:hypothetical protein
MRHDGHADLLGNLRRDVERHSPRAAGRAGADAHLDADDDVAIGVRHLSRVDRGHEADLLALTDHHAGREGVDACEGDMEIGEDAHLAAFDHVLAEAKLPGPALPVSTAVGTPERRQKVEGFRSFNGSDVPERAGSDQPYGNPIRSPFVLIYQYTKV